MVRSPFLEADCLFSASMAVIRDLRSKGADLPDLPSEIPLFMKNPIEYAATLEGPRIIKTHMPMCMLNPEILKTCKGTDLFL